MKTNRLIALVFLSLCITSTCSSQNPDLKALWEDYRALERAGKITKAALILRQIGKKEARLKHFEAAEKAYAGTLRFLGEKAPKKALANLWLEIASLHRKMGQPEIALIELRHASTLGRPSSKLILEQARICADLNRFDEAQKNYTALFKAVKKRHGNNHRSIAKVFAEMSVLYARAGQLKRAKTLLERGLLVNKKLKDNRVKTYEKRQRKILVKLTEALSSRNDVVSS